MPIVGKDEHVFMGDVSKDSMYGYARKFHEVQENLIKENQIDFGIEPVRALLVPGNREALKEFFVEDCMIGGETRDGHTINFNHEQVADEKAMMEQAFNNDVQAIRESAVAGLATFNPMVGLSLPMHKYLMMNCVFAQALPRFVAKSPMWSESIESRFMVNPDGTKIDLAQEQNKIYKMWQSIQRPVEVPIKVAEYRTVDILNDAFGVSKLSENLSVDTHIDAILINAYAKTGDTVVTMADNTDTTVTNPQSFTESAATKDGLADMWFPWEARFNPGYGETNIAA